MKILILHTRYRQPGGEDQSFASEATLLRRHGHDVHTLVFENADLRGLPPWRQAVVVMWNRAAYRRMQTEIRKHRPRVVHIHNTFPLASPGVIHAAKAEGVPVVMSLRNYRLLCVNGLLFRDDHPCVRCLGRMPWRGALHGCYSGSRIASTVVAGMTILHRRLGTWGHVDRFIALTEFARQLFLESGLPADKIAVKPNYFDIESKHDERQGGYVLFVGRLSPEKGLPSLLDAWNSLSRDVRLKVVGDGPLRPEMEFAARTLPNIDYLGPKSLQDVFHLITGATFLVIPSQCYETFGRVAMEAFAAGTPVLAASIGAIGEITDNGRTGLHFRPGDPSDLAAKVDWLLSHPKELAQMRTEARREYEAKYTAERNHEMLMEIYAQAIANHRKR